MRVGGHTCPNQPEGLVCQAGLGSDVRRPPTRLESIATPRLMRTRVISKRSPGSFLGQRLSIPRNENVVAVVPEARSNIPYFTCGEKTAFEACADFREYLDDSNPAEEHDDTIGIGWLEAWLNNARTRNVSSFSGASRRMPTMELAVDMGDIGVGRRDLRRWGCWQS